MAGGSAIKTFLGIFEFPHGDNRGQAQPATDKEMRVGR